MEVNERLKVVAAVIRTPPIPVCAATTCSVSAGSPLAAAPPIPTTIASARHRRLIEHRIGFDDVIGVFCSVCWS